MKGSISHSEDRSRVYERNPTYRPNRHRKIPGRASRNLAMSVQFYLAIDFRQRELELLSLADIDSVGVILDYDELRARGERGGVFTAHLEQAEIARNHNIRPE